MSKIKAFLHPTMLRTERNFKRLMKDFPAGTGYGVAIMLIEILSSEEEEQKIHIQDIDLISDEIGVSIPILKTIISKYNIFTVEDNYIKCPMLEQWLQPFKKRIEQNRKAGQISAEKRKEKERQQELQLLQNLSVTNSTQQVFNTCSTNKIKQNKIKQNKIKENKIKENKIKENKIKEIKNTTTTCSCSSGIYEKWIEEKCKNAKNPQAYKATLLQMYRGGEKSVVVEFEEWKKLKKRQQKEEKLISFQGKKIMLEEGEIYEILGVENKEDGLHVYLDNPYLNSHQILFSSFEEIEKRIQHAS